MKALALLSGGLDSILAAKVIQAQGIDCLGLHFLIPFSADKSSAFSGTGIEFQVVDVRGEFLKIMEKPRHGFGSRMNPCIDCKIFMLNKARQLLTQLSADFVITGEVLGQRPMSQHKKALALIEEESGLGGLLLRPLSAKLLPETIPEKKGWLKREKLLDFSGRCRNNQIDLAREFGMQAYSQPAGGCLLTDPQFCLRLKDLITHERMELENIELLKIGRYFRLSPQVKLVVGRNQKENEKILSLAKPQDVIFMPTDELAGPTALGRGNFDAELIGLSCGIVARYCDLEGRNSAKLIFKQFGRQDIIFEATALAQERVTSLRI